MRKSPFLLAVLVVGACSPLPPLHVTRPHDCGTVAVQDVQNSTDIQDIQTNADVLPDVPAPVDVPTEDVGPPPAPLTATGQFHVVLDVLPDLELDQGIKGKAVPHDSAGVFADLDGDGMLDVVLGDGMRHVYVGMATQAWQWTFTQVLQQEMAGIQTLATIDLDGKGIPAIAVSGAALHLLVRQPNGTWLDEAGARGLVDATKQNTQGITVADVDADGLLDLLVTRFACGPESRLLAFVNQGDGHVAERGADLGVDQHATLWNVLQADVDGDSRADLLTMVEGCDPKSGNAYLHATEQGYVRTVLPPSFLAEGQENSSPMGGAHVDMDGDGRLDVVLSGIGLRDLRMQGQDVAKVPLPWLISAQSSATQLLKQLPDGQFQGIGAVAGLTRPLSPTGQTMVSWTVLPLDLDFDGRMDLFVTHAHDYGSFLLADEGGMRPVLFRNQGNGTFADVSATFGLPKQHLGGALAWADVDGDGDADLLLGGQTVQPQLLRNDVGHGGHWLRLKLHGILSNPQGLAARVELKTSAGVRVQAMGGVAASHAQVVPELLFALPDGELPQQVTVHWPSGFVQTQAVQADVSVTVEEPALVTVSARKVAMGGQIVVKARSFAADGTGDGQAVAIELAPGMAGGWLGAQTCGADGTCTRTWQAPLQGSGQARLAVTVAGKPWIVQPILRW